MSISFTIQHFASLMGQVNDGNIVLNSKEGSGQQTLERVNRGNVFTRHKWKQQDVSSAKNGAANQATRSALFNALCQHRGLDANSMTNECVMKLKNQLGLNDVNIARQPLTCRAVKQLLDDAGVEVAARKNNQNTSIVLNETPSKVQKDSFKQGGVTLYSNDSDDSNPYRNDSEKYSIKQGGVTPYSNDSDDSNPYRNDSQKYSIKQGGVTPYSNDSDDSNPYRNDSEDSNPYRNDSQKYSIKQGGVTLYSNDSEEINPYLNGPDDSNPYLNDSAKQSANEIREEEVVFNDHLLIDEGDPNNPFLNNFKEDDDLVLDRNEIIDNQFRNGDDEGGVEAGLADRPVGEGNETPSQVHENRNDSEEINPYLDDQKDSFKQGGETSYPVESGNETPSQVHENHDDSEEINPYLTDLDDSNQYRNDSAKQSANEIREEEVGFPKYLMDGWDPNNPFENNYWEKGEFKPDHDEIIVKQFWNGDDEGGFEAGLADRPVGGKERSLDELDVRQNLGSDEDQDDRDLKNQVMEGYGPNAFDH